MNFTLVPSGGLHYDASRSAHVIVEGSSSLVLSCSVQGDHEFTIMWIHNQMELTGPRYVFTSDTSPSGHVRHILTVRHVISDDSGNYSCKGNNSYGSHQVTETVKVIGQFSDCKIIRFDSIIFYFISSSDCLSHCERSHRCSESR